MDYFWKDSKGNKTPLSLLEDNHLINAFLKLERTSIERWYKWIQDKDDGYTGGYGLDIDTDTEEVFGPRDFLDHDIIYNALRREIEGRGMGMMFKLRDRKARKEAQQEENYWV